MSDLYQVLGVKRAASPKDIRKAYRRKAKTSHPDGGGSVEAFHELITAYTVLSDARRREKYDETGEIDPPRPNNLDGSAIEIIAQKLGLIIHAEQDVTQLDIGLLIEQAIREDIDQRKASVGHQKRAAERVLKLRARAKRKANGEDNLLARVLDWHAASIKTRIKKDEEAVCSMERALEILEDYSFGDDEAPQAEEVSDALIDILDALNELAAVLNTGQRDAEVMMREAVLRDAAPGACG